MKIALTGSIACGKTTVANHLRSLGYTVLDADQISHDLTADHGQALPAIEESFPGTVTATGRLDRHKLAEIVFSDPSKRAILEGILHPMIRERMQVMLEAGDSPKGLIFGDVPLLYEAGFDSDYDSVWVVSATHDLQISRMQERDSLSAEEAEKRIAAQMPLSEKEKRADAVITTNGTLEETCDQVDVLVRTVLASLSPPSIPRRRVRSVPIETVSEKMEIPPKPRPSPFSGLPRPLRLTLSVLLILVLCISAFFITRDFLARQEERRRLEAEAAERAQHPLYYGDLVLSYSRLRGLDPALVSAIILCESSYNPKAESRLGARGLMQIMEDTAEWIAHRLSVSDYSFDLLYDPETNISFGTWYLAYLANRFSHDPKKMVCAYHAGQGNVDKWLSNPDYSHDGITLDVIPTSDTAAYCDKVLKARDKYEKYYFPTPSPVPSPTPSID